MRQDESEVVVTVLVCPFNVLINEPSRVLHSFRVLSPEPDNIVEPSGEKQQPYTYFQFNRSFFEY